MAPKILCVEPDTAVVESRCAVLKSSRYDVVSASPRVAEIVLRGRKFDLLIISSLSDGELDRLLGFSDGAEVLVLDGFTPPSELLFLVSERLARQQRA